MKLSKLIECLNKLAENPNNLSKKVIVTGAYASDGEILRVREGKKQSYADESGMILIDSDICSG